jgi:hypothetical protein
MILPIEAADELFKSVLVLQHCDSFQMFEFVNNPATIILRKLANFAWTFVVETKPKHDAYQGLELFEVNRNVLVLH